MMPVGDALTLDMHNKKIAKHRGTIKYTLTRALACLEAWLPGKPLISRMSLCFESDQGSLAACHNNALPPWVER